MVKDGGEERPENKLEFSGRIRFRDLEETQTDPGTPAKKSAEMGLGYRVQVPCLRGGCARRQAL